MHVDSRKIESLTRELLLALGENPVGSNAEMRVPEVRTFCALEPKGAALIRGAIERLGLSARAYTRILKVARTIADLDGYDAITAAQVAEAIQYRSLDRSFH